MWPLRKNVENHWLKGDTLLKLRNVTSHRVSNLIGVWIHLLVLLGHVISEKPGVIGCFGSLIFIHPHPGDPTGGDQSPACVQVACCSTDPPYGSTATEKPSLRPLRCLRWLFSIAVLSLQGVWGFAAVSGQRSLGTRPRLARSEFSSRCSGTPSWALRT